MGTTIYIYTQIHIVFPSHLLYSVIPVPIPLTVRTSDYSVSIHFFFPIDLQYSPHIQYAFLMIDSGGPFPGGSEGARSGGRAAGRLRPSLRPGPEVWMGWRFDAISPIN